MFKKLIALFKPKAKEVEVANTDLQKSYWFLLDGLLGRLHMHSYRTGDVIVLGTDGILCRRECSELPNAIPLHDLDVDHEIEYEWYVGNNVTPEFLKRIDIKRFTDAYNKVLAVYEFVTEHKNVKVISENRIYGFCRGHNLNFIRPIASTTGETSNELVDLWELDLDNLRPVGTELDRPLTYFDEHATRFLESVKLARRYLRGNPMFIKVIVVDDYPIQAVIEEYPTWISMGLLGPLLVPDLLTEKLTYIPYPENWQYLTSLEEALEMIDRFSILIGGSAPLSGWSEAEREYINEMVENY